MPETRYALNGDVSIAYQVIGDGPTDLVYVPGWVSNVELMWEDPTLARFLRRLGSFARLSTFDKRGTGLSDGVSPSELPDLEARMDDLRAVMDAAGSEKAAVFGHSEGGVLSILFAATHPERTTKLILTGAYAKRIRSDDYPWAPTKQERLEFADSTLGSWGSDVGLAEMAPSRQHDPAFRTWWGRYQRLSASPRAASALIAMNSQADVTGVLHAVTAPTLLLYRTHDADVTIEEGRYIAGQIDGSRIVELEGADHLFWAGDSNRMLDEIEDGHCSRTRIAYQKLPVMHGKPVGLGQPWRRFIPQNETTKTARPWA